jgi:hypothetical protein
MFIQTIGVSQIGADFELGYLRDSSFIGLFP